MRSRSSFPTRSNSQNQQRAPVHNTFSAPQSPGIMSSLATGASLGVGSAIGHEAVRGLFGARTENYGQPQQERRNAVDISANQERFSVCDLYIRQLQSCLRRVKETNQTDVCQSEVNDLNNAIADNCFNRMI